MWDLPGPGLEPMSSELAGGFLTTAPPGKTSAATLTDVENTPTSRGGGPVGRIQ